MAKVMVTLSVENDDEKHDFHGLGILQRDQLVFLDQNVKTILFLTEDIKLIREDLETKTILDFSMKDGSRCELKNRSISLPLACELSYIKQEEQKIELHYKVEDQLFKLYIEYEVLK